MKKLHHKLAFLDSIKHFKRKANWPKISNKMVTLTLHIMRLMSFQIPWRMTYWNLYLTIKLILSYGSSETQDLKMGHVSFLWIPCLLSSDQIQYQFTVCKELKNQNEHEGNDFFMTLWQWIYLGFSILT